jgi:hypothetical protein
MVCARGNLVEASHVPQTTPMRLMRGNMMNRDTFLSYVRSMQARNSQRCLPCSLVRISNEALRPYQQAISTDYNSYVNPMQARWAGGPVIVCRGCLLAICGDLEIPRRVYPDGTSVLSHEHHPEKKRSSTLCLGRCSGAPGDQKLGLPREATGVRPVEDLKVVRRIEI